MYLVKRICHALTVEVGRPDKGDVHSEVPVVRGAVEAQVDAEWYGRPCWILLTAVEAYLPHSVILQMAETALLTRFADLVLSFSKIFCDCAFVALMVLPYLRANSWEKGER